MNTDHPLEGVMLDGSPLVKEIVSSGSSPVRVVVPSTDPWSPGKPKGTVVPTGARIKMGE
mgnify:CR=1 FL=1